LFFPNKLGFFGAKKWAKLNKLKNTPREAVLRLQKIEKTYLFPKRSIMSQIGFRDFHEMILIKIWCHIWIPWVIN
jgi:hypothetical protein